MKTWKVGSTWYRGYWGSDKITSFSSDFESDDTGTTRVRLGDMPTPGRWVRLDVTEAQMGMSGTVAVDGLSLASFGGQALWDDIGTGAGSNAVIPDRKSVV